MKHPTSIRLIALLGFAALPLGANAQITYINETFDSYTIGSAPPVVAGETPLKRTTLVTVAAGNDDIGTGGQVAAFTDNSTTIGGILEYNAGAAALGSLHISFDLFNNNPTLSSDPLYFSVGNWNTSTSVLLNAAAKRSFGLEFNQSTGGVVVRHGGGTYSGTYDTGALVSVSIFLNDHDTNTLDYLMPGTSTVATLNANSAVVFLNGTLVGDATSGFVMSTVTGSGNTTGDATLGRLGFNSNTTQTVDFLIDNLYVTDVSAIPEPSAYAALAGVGGLGLAFWRRRRRA